MNGDQKHNTIQNVSKFLHILDYAKKKSYVFFVIQYNTFWKDQVQENQLYDDEKKIIHTKSSEHKSENKTKILFLWTNALFYSSNEQM